MHGNLECQVHAATAVTSVCPTLCNPTDSSPPGSPSLGFSSKNTGVRCHFLVQCMKVKRESEVAPVVSDSSQPHGLQPTRLPCPWDFPGKSTEVGCHFLLVGFKALVLCTMTTSCSQGHRMQTIVLLKASLLQCFHQYQKERLLPQCTCVIFSWGMK